MKKLASILLLFFLLLGVSVAGVRAQQVTPMTLQECILRAQARSRAFNQRIKQGSTRLQP